MTPDQLKQARQTLSLSAAKLAERLRMGKDGGRAVRRWESGEVPVSGPASVAIEYMLKEKK